MRQHTAQRFHDALTTLRSFRQPPSLYSLRGCNAYYLDIFCQRRCTAQRMIGHGEEIEAYMEFLPKTFTTDLQRASRGQEARETTLFLSLRLGPCSNASTNISIDVISAIKSHPKYRTLLQC